MKSSFTSKLTWAKILYFLLLLLLALDVLHASFTKLGDFVGYIQAGNLVLDGAYIYEDILINTWPPFFSIVCVPLSLIDSISPQLVRLLWLIGSMIAFFYTIKLILKSWLSVDLSIRPWMPKEKLSKHIMHLSHPVVVIPIFIILRVLISNIGNIQINILMLLMGVAAIYLFERDRKLLGALLLAFSISIKIITIFIFLYFVFKREYKFILYTFAFILLFALVPFLVFGIETSIDYYQAWVKNNLEPFAKVNHKNQSLFGMFRRLFMNESPGMAGPLQENVFVNVLSLRVEQAKMLSYGIVGFAGVFVMILFHKKLEHQSVLIKNLEYVFVLTLIPILSPLAWKAYFIFLFPAYFVNVLLLYYSKSNLSSGVLKFLKSMHWFSILMITFSSELFLGNRLSDYMEVYSCFTIGTLVLLINIVIFYKQEMKDPGSFQLLTN